MTLREFAQYPCYNPPDVPIMRAGSRRGDQRPPSPPPSIAGIAWWRFERRDIRVGGEGSWRFILPWRRNREVTPVARTRVQAKV